VGTGKVAEKKKFESNSVSVYFDSRPEHCQLIDDFSHGFPHYGSRIK